MVVTQSRKILPHSEKERDFIFILLYKRNARTLQTCTWSLGAVMALCIDDVKPFPRTALGYLYRTHLVTVTQCIIIITWTGCEAEAPHSDHYISKIQPNSEEINGLQISVHYPSSYAYVCSSSCSRHSRKSLTCRKGNNLHLEINGTDRTFFFNRETYWKKTLMRRKTSSCE